MKNFSRIFLAVLLGLLFNHQVIAQSAPFKQEMIITSVNGVTLPEDLKITFSAKDPDQGKKGAFKLFDGSPTKEQVHNTIFVGDYPKRQGRFFLTPQYKYKLPFTLSYQWRYPVVDGWGYPLEDKYFDEITVSKAIKFDKD